MTGPGVRRVLSWGLLAAGREYMPLPRALAPRGQCPRELRRLCLPLTRLMLVLVCLRWRMWSAALSVAAG
jgi:hypothetical protein